METIQGRGIWYSRQKGNLNQYIPLLVRACHDKAGNGDIETFAEGTKKYQNQEAFSTTVKPTRVETAKKPTKLGI